MRGAPCWSSARIGPPSHPRRANFGCWGDRQCLASLEGDEKYVYHYGNRPDEEPYGFALEAPEGGTPRGAHASTQEMRVPLVLSGAGVRQDAAPRNPRLVDVAPTVTALLGARPPNDAQGRSLTEALVGRRAGPST